MCLWGVVDNDNAAYLGGRIPKTPIMGEWIRAFKPNAKMFFKPSYYLNYYTDSNQILHDDKYDQVFFLGGSNNRQLNPRWRTAVILQKID